MAPPRRLLSLLMPVYNERDHLRVIVETVLAQSLPDGLDRELVLVDDASRDGTDQVIAELAGERPGVLRAFRQDPNQGKGAAIRRAIREMRGDFALIQDADLEYNPADYPAVLAPLLDGRADAVYGSRFAPRPERRAVRFRHKLGNAVLTLASNWLTNLDLTDMETCYKAFRGDLLKSLPLTSNRFGIEPEVTAMLAHRRARVWEVPIDYRGRDYDEGKKIGWKDGVSAFWTMFGCWWRHS